MCRLLLLMSRHERLVIPSGLLASGQWQFHDMRPFYGFWWRLAYTHSPLSLVSRCATRFTRKRRSRSGSAWRQQIVISHYIFCSLFLFFFFKKWLRRVASTTLTPFLLLDEVTDQLSRFAAFHFHFGDSCMLVFESGSHSLHVPPYRIRHSKM